ncbi:hypothetical protein DNTS_025731 [Danionella cerebrum]|uniref:Uncharacterized protein n=1 Tax=Danionella cerebrum TaxID=2873325 RepID=A0A553RD48_9TELE|nr:hypothetical protein DNTS_025731 [Danionella translucida]
MDIVRPALMEHLRLTQIIEGSAGAGSATLWWKFATETLRYELEKVRLYSFSQKTKVSPPHYGPARVDAPPAWFCQGSAYRSLRGVRCRGDGTRQAAAGRWSD